jgi:hypothetical protein
LARALAWSVIWLITAAVLSLILNMTGDCRPEIANCGDSQRHISFAIVGIGVVTAAWPIIRHLSARGAK